MSFVIFNQVERYHVAREVIRCLHGEKEKCRILEVGAGRHGNSARYFPNDDVLFTDIIYTEEDLKDPRFMLADATNLPFQDNAFDFVIGLDVLEHIHPTQRASMLQEIYRVAQIGVFLSFPHNSPKSQLDEQLEHIYLSCQKEPPIWLHEHDEMGLPSFDTIYQLVTQSISPQHVFGAHGVDYELNRTMLRLEAYASCNPALMDTLIQVNNAYVEDVLVHDLGGCIEDSVKSYLVLSKLPLNDRTSKSLQGIFAKDDRQVITGFRKHIADQFKAWMKEQAAVDTKEDGAMGDQNVMTAMLEVMDRVDQMMKNLGASVEEKMSRLAQAQQQEIQRHQEEENRIVMNIILITYNQEKYIKTTLRSILDQKTDFAFNIIVADDCSKDKTVSIIQEMEKQTDIPFVYLDNSRNHGIMQNYKRAFAACDAEYVAIMEGDDIWTDPYRLQKHKTFLESHLECAMSFNQFVVKDFKKGTADLMPKIVHDNLETYRIFSGADLAYDNLIGNFSTCVYKNAYLQRLPQRLYDVHAYDWLTNIFIAQMGLVGCLLQPMSIYRIHSAGIWSQKTQQDKLKEIIDMTIIYDELTDHEFTLGFTAHRNRLEAQLRLLEGVGNPAPAPAAEQPVPTVKQNGVKKFLKKVCVRLRGYMMRILDCLPPMVTLILKWLVPPVIVRKIKNVRE